MRASKIILFSLMLGAPAVAQKQSLGIFARWGAFAADGGARCYAIAEPERPAGAEGARPFASVGYWRGRGPGGQLNIRFAREKRRGSAVLLRIDARTFQLAGGGVNAWAPDAGADAEIVAAMRTGIDMVVDTRAVNGTRMRDHYALRGAATAIDAAAIACAPRRR